MSIATEKIIPAYIPWETFTEFVRHLQQTSVPSHIDKSVMPDGMPILTRGQIQSALRFLKLIEDDGTITKRLGDLVFCLGHEKWGEAVKKHLVPAYDVVIGDLDLANATQHKLDQRFEAVGVAGQMLSKSVRFYLALLKEAGISFSPHLMAKRKGTSSPRRRSPKPPLAGLTALNELVDGNSSNPKKDSHPVVPGTKSYPLYFKNKTTGALIVPDDLTEADCKVIELQLQVLKAYVEQ